MTGRRTVLRVAGVLISEACRRLPADSRHDREQEWTAELAVIIDDPSLRPRWRRHLRAMRFAMAQSRTVRRLTRPAGLERVRAIMVRTALASAGAAVVLAVSAIILDTVAGRSSSDSSPVVGAEIWALTLAMAAGLLCALIMASLGMTRVARSFRPRASREAGIGQPAWRAARLARAALVGGVLAFTAAAIAETVSTSVHGPSAVSRLLALSAALLAIGGAACLGVAAILAVAAAVARLWRLNRRVQGAAGVGDGPRRR